MVLQALAHSHSQGPGSGGLAFNSMPPVGGGSPGLESYLSASLAGLAAAGMGQNVPVPINALNGLGGIALSPEGMTSQDQWIIY